MFSERLRELRNEKKISQKELAEILFVSQQTVAKWETDRSTPNPEMISKIAQYFEVSSDTFVTISKFGSRMPLSQFPIVPGDTPNASANFF